MRRTLICLICCLSCLACAYTSQAQTSGSIQPDSRPPTTPPTDTVVNKNLNWLPGLGQGTVHLPSNQSPANYVSGQTVPRTTPPVASPIAGAQPLSTNSLARDPLALQPGRPAHQPVPQSVLRDMSELHPGTVSPVNPGNASGEIGAVYPVAPATLIQDAQNQNNIGNGLESGIASGNSQLVDSRITTVTRGMQQLPNESGQVWRTYDISPYTYSVQTATRPEQAIIDWILKETGTEMWFAEPMGILHASREKLHIYHTPAVQSRIKPIIDRFVYSRGKPQIVGLRLVTIASPDWRASAFSMMQPVQVNSPGVEAWLVSKENAAVLAGMLANRADYTEQSNGNLTVSDGQSYTLSRTRPIEFTRSLGLVNDGNPRYEAIRDRVDEGYVVQFSALSSLDGKSIEAIVGCDINQIEKMQRVTLEVPTASGQSSPFDLQIPQLVSWKVNERFRWPSDKVLVLSCGVVATPGPQRQALMGIPAIFNGNRRRADALMFIEYKGLAQALPGTAPSTSFSPYGQPGTTPGGTTPVTVRR